MNGVSAQEENDTTHEKMMELEPLLEASGEHNLRSIDIAHGECPCHCLAQTVWYPEYSNHCLVWDVEEIRSIGLPDHRQNVTILVVSTLLALRWIEENVTKYRESKTPTAESIYAIDYSRRLELFETACKVFAIPTAKGTEWLNGVFQIHINQLESDLLDMAQFTLGPPRSLPSLSQDPCPIAWE